MLIVSACNSSGEFLIKQEPLVILPDREMFVCPDSVNIPNLSTVTDIQVAQVIVELKTNLEICRNKLKSLEIFLIEAKKRLEN